MARPSLGQALAFAATALVIAAVAYTFSIIEGPATMRAQRLDDQRVRHLRAIASAVDCYWTLEAERGLPPDLESLVDRMEAETREKALPAWCRPASVSDPETGAPMATARSAAPGTSFARALPVPAVTKGVVLST